MSHACHHHHHEPSPGNTPAYRRVLWAALVINAAMAVVEITAGWRAGSLALWADALDFVGDAANYGASLAVLSAGLLWRARLAWLKGLAMAIFGVGVLARAAWAALHGEPPQAATMGIVGTLALLANVGVAVMLYAWREGDANMRAVWLCSRNDALGNVAVVAAAGAVALTGQAWPDLLVAVVMASLALHSSRDVLRQARAEIRSAA
ncbi:MULTISPECIES: cation transporter [unclassified Roseateles]|uniref:cation transporter n=1 Tax=unclassified Roseateles TaxID=2626991 RepID=UPI0006FD7C06|nr:MULTISPECIES: cation transporter [unclassified Roseateles]KQW51305.1 cation transporter [Pelomonas sp. Root405]KRA77537.1 cation transporter [Pelomonas sp. Root662]